MFSELQHVSNCYLPTSRQDRHTGQDRVFLLRTHFLCKLYKNRARFFTHIQVAQTARPMVRRRGDQRQKNAKKIVFLLKKIAQCVDTARRYVI